VDGKKVEVFRSTFFSFITPYRHSPVKNKSSRGSADKSREDYYEDLGLWCLEVFSQCSEKQNNLLCYVTLKA
jgi:hypothetical protein